MEEILSFGYRLRRRRKALDLTQADLGKLVGASAAMIRKIEADERRPSRELAELLAEHLEVPVSEREAFLRGARHVTITGTPVAPRTSPAPSASNLPAPMTSMVNRVRDLAQVTTLLLREDVRLLTLLGPPGMGKTRLSIQAAERALSHFGDGVWFVDLSPITDPNLMLPAIATTLGLAPAPGLSPVEQVHKALREKQLLLVLDNLEQVVDRAAEDVAGLLRACRDVKVLATSRVRLDVYGEHEYALPPMSIPLEGSGNTPDELLEYEAVQLFIARARQHQPDFGLTAETAGPVAEICRRMDGIPLALELAAARTRRMPVAELVAALRGASGHDWHALLHNTVRDMPPRQQTLANAIAWSDSLLEPGLKTMLRQLSVFAGPFDWPAVDAVIEVAKLDLDQAKRGALEQLVDHNLVSQISNGPDRWRLLEMVREFARERLSPDEAQVVLRRHADYYATLLADLVGTVGGNAYLSAVDAVADNGRAALHWALQTREVHLAYRLSAAFEWYWEQRGLMREGYHFLERTLALGSDVNEALRFEVLHAAANQAWLQHNLAVAHRHTADGLALAYEKQEDERVAGFLNLQARVFLEEGQFEKADQALVEGIRLGGQLPRKMNPSFMIIQRGEVALALGRLDEAEARLRQGLAGVLPKDVIPFCVGWTDLAEVMLAGNNPLAAKEALQHVAPLAHLHARRTRCFVVAVAGCSLSGKPVTAEEAMAAVRLLGWVAAMNEQLGDPLSVMVRKFIAERMEAARECLQSGQWQSAWEEGWGWSLDEAMACASEVLAKGPA